MRSQRLKFFVQKPLTVFLIFFSLVLVFIRIYVLDLIIAIYEMRFGERVPYYIKIKSFTELYSKKEALVELKDALKYNISILENEYSNELEFRDLKIEYEKRFKRRIHLGEVDADVAVFHLKKSLKNNIPYHDNYVFAYSDKLFAVYELMFKKSTFPSWFYESSKDAKLCYLEYALNTRDGKRYGRHFHPYLSKEEEDSLKIQLNNVVKDYEKKFNKEITELEKVKIEYKLQFNGYGGKVPVYQCSEEELFLVLRCAIKMNRPVYSGSVNEIDINFAVNYCNKCGI